MITKFIKFNEKYIHTNEFTKYLYLRNDSHFEIEFEIEIIMIPIRRLIHKTTLKHE